MTHEQQMRWGALIYTVSMIDKAAKTRGKNFNDLPLKYSEIKRYTKSLLKPRKKQRGAHDEIYSRT